MGERNRQKGWGNPLVAFCEVVADRGRRSRECLLGFFPFLVNLAKSIDFIIKTPDFRDVALEVGQGNVGFGRG